MTGRDLYRKYEELRGNRDEWWRLSGASQLAWDDLAEWVAKPEGAAA
jgi:hypothetical protein